MHLGTCGFYCGLHLEMPLAVFMIPAGAYAIGGEPIAYLTFLSRGSWPFGKSLSYLFGGGRSLQWRECDLFHLWSLVAGFAPFRHHVCDWFHLWTWLPFEHFLWDILFTYDSATLYLLAIRQHHGCGLHHSQRVMQPWRKQARNIVHWSLLSTFQEGRLLKPSLSGPKRHLQPDHIDGRLWRQISWSSVSTTTPMARTNGPLALASGTLW